MINDCPLALMQSSIMVPSDPNSGSRRRRLYRYRFHFLMAMKERLMAENVANVSVVGRVLVFILLRDGVLDGHRSSIAAIAIIISQDPKTNGRGHSGPSLD